jgi:hypothetical protein
MRSFAEKPWIRRIGLLVAVLGAFGFAAAAQADDRHRSRDAHARSHYSKHYSHDHRRSYDSKHHHHPTHGHKHSPKHAHPDWHYHAGRYWAPPSYRGRYCSDLRHYHVAHYHVAVRDYYDYYYPRYRYHGPHPHHANASLIISIPLF